MQEKRGCGIVDISKDGPFLEGIFFKTFKREYFKKANEKANKNKGEKEKQD